MRQVHVAIGVIADSALRRGRVLITRRAKGDRFEHCWEFPGGKIEPGETSEQCIHREVQEELGVRVRIVAALDVIEHDYGDFRVRLYPFVLAVEEGTTQALASCEARWVTMKEITQTPFPEANAALIRDLPGILRGLGLLDG